MKPRPYRIYLQKTGSCFWSVNYTTSKILFLCSGNELQIFKYPLFERTLCIDTYRINFVIKKWNCKAILHIFGKRKLQWCWNTFRFSLGEPHQNHDVAATLTPGRKNDVGNATLWQHYSTSWPKHNQNLTLLQRHVRAGLWWTETIQRREKASKYFVQYCSSYSLVA